MLGYDGIDRCPVCGRPSIICQDPANQLKWRAGDPVRCHATTAALDKQKAYTEDKNPNMSALTWPVYLKG